MRVALVSTYDGGMQPIALATATAELRALGIEVAAYDSYITPICIGDLSTFDLIVFSVQVFEGLAGAVELARGLRQSTRKEIGFFGPYASLNAEALAESCADWVIKGDPEEALADICLNHERNHQKPILASRSSRIVQSKKRGHFLVPDRSLLPALKHYKYVPAVKFIGETTLVGNVETARGCRFKCSYCSVYAVSHGKVAVIPTDIIIADINKLCEMGVEHVCFSDAEFLNAPKHSLDVIRTMNEVFPHLTFDFTSRADLLVGNPALVNDLVNLGARFVTTAFEFPKSEVLSIINKGFDKEVLYRAVQTCKDSGLRLNPTFLLFNPWINADDIRRFWDFLGENDLLKDVDGIQFTTRLWLYKGSPLLQRWDVQECITKEHEFHFEWRHKDEAVERLFAEMQERYGQVSGRCCLKC